MVTNIFETQCGLRNLFRRSESDVTYFSRHFMLRWYVQLRLSTENEHFFDEEPGFSTQMLLWDQIWGARSYHFPWEIMILLYLHLPLERGELYRFSFRIEHSRHDSCRVQTWAPMSFWAGRKVWMKSQNDDFWTKMVTFDTSDLVSETDLRPKSWCPTEKMFVLNAQTELRVPPQHKVSRKNIYNHFPTVSECF